MRCKKCGKKITADIRFCPECGTEAGRKTKRRPAVPRKERYIAAAVTAAMLCIAIAVGLGMRSLNRFKSFSEKEEEFQAMFEKLNLNESQETAYQSLINELKNGFEKGSMEKIEEAANALDFQYQQCVSENLALIEDSRRKLDAVSSGLLQAEQQLIQQYQNNADIFLNEKDYRKALDEYEKCTAFYKNIERSQGYRFKVEQVDALSFPNIKLYVSACPDQSDVSIPLEKDGLCLKELCADIYQDTEITRVSRLDEKEKLNICLAADISGSMYEQMDLAKNAMAQFVNCIQYFAGDRCALITFDNTVTLDKDFTGNGQELVNAIQNLYVGNCTALYDALYVAVCKAAEEDGAKCVIAFTDGYDNVSTKTENDVITASRMYGIPVYLIGIGDEADLASLQQISSTADGYYYNIYDSSMMQEIYNSIYKKNKELYLIEYTARTADKNAFQNLYLTYDDGTVFMRCQSDFQPSQLLAKEQEYTSIIQDTGIANSDIENEVLRIRSIYNDIVAQRDNHNYTEASPAAGVTSYHENGNLRCVIIGKGIHNSPYTRYYYYDGGKLIFAYLESDDSHRLYFKMINCSGGAMPPMQRRSQKQLTTIMRIRPSSGHGRHSL